MNETSSVVTGLLVRWRNGDRKAFDELVDLLYDDLRQRARRRMKGERAASTLETTELVHEAFVRLVGNDASWQDRAHFLAAASRQMRLILVDRARARLAEKRGGGQIRVSLDEQAMGAGSRSAEVLELDQALNRLAENDARKARVVELHVFGGMTYKEVGEVLGVSDATARLDFRVAKAWLRSELGREERDDR